MLGRASARVLATRGAAIVLTLHAAGSIVMGFVVWDASAVTGGVAWLFVAAAAHDTRTAHLRNTRTEETTRS